MVGDPAALTRYSIRETGRASGLPGRGVAQLARDARRADRPVTKTTQLSHPDFQYRVGLLVLENHVQAELRKAG